MRQFTSYEISLQDMRIINQYSLCVSVIKYKTVSLCSKLIYHKILYNTHLCIAHKKESGNLFIPDYSAHPSFTSQYDLKAYLESKLKMCVCSLTNTNQNSVVLSLCLVFLNAHVNVPNSSLNFRQYSLW